MAIDPFGEVPLYRQLADVLRLGIADGTYPPKHPLPSTRALAAQHEMAIGTVRKAFDLLRAEGLVRNVPGKGAFVVEHPEVRNDAAVGFGLGASWPKAEQDDKTARRRA